MIPPLDDSNRPHSQPRLAAIEPYTSASHALYRSYFVLRLQLSLHWNFLLHGRDSSLEPRTEFSPGRGARRGLCVLRSFIAKSGQGAGTTPAADLVAHRAGGNQPGGGSGER